MPDSPLHAEPPTLDPSALARLRELDPDDSHGVTARVLGAFENSLQRMLVQLAETGAVVQADTVARVAHTLKSSSASVGALELSRTCAEIEVRLREGHDGELLTDIARLLAAGESALLAVRAMLRK
jgi:HPt (histidine-containing phosphotransfer) domain-containing protein